MKQCIECEYFEECEITENKCADDKACKRFKEFKTDRAEHGKNKKFKRNGRNKNNERAK